MEEKVLIKSEQYNTKMIGRSLLLISIGIILLGFICYALNIDHSRISSYWNREWSIIDNMFDPFSFIPGMMIDIGGILLIVCLLINWWLSSFELTVTDKRVYGASSFGKQVDLPVDSISSISSSTMKGIAIATSSGKIIFKFIKNRDNVRDVIAKLIIDRQSTNRYATEHSTSDELLKYKSLLDNGTITQEEFEAKKKQLLGL